MPMLCFYPWLQINGQKTFGNFELIPYVRDQENNTLSPEEQSHIDIITKPYILHKDFPIKKFTLLKHKNHTLTDDLDEQSRDSAFEFSELLAFSGLSIRDFFLHCNYCNRDNYTLIIQGYNNPGKGVAISSKRRDGNVLGFWSQDSYQVQKPEHISTNDIIEIDELLLNSLLKIKKNSIGNTITEAIIFYNLANKDSPEMRNITEIILLVSAFERLISPKMGSERALSEIFCSLLVPSNDLDLSECQRLSPTILPKFKNSKTLRDIWIRDMFRVRGNHAHGIVALPYPAVWSLINHLLLGSFIFPIILKLKLHKLDYYKINEKDEIAIEAFERLACVEHFPTNLDPLDRADPQRHSWNKIINIVAHERIWKKIEEELRKKQNVTTNPE